MIHERVIYGTTCGGRYSRNIAIARDTVERGLRLTIIVPNLVSLDRWIREGFKPSQISWIGDSGYRRGFS